MEIRALFFICLLYLLPLQSSALSIESDFESAHQKAVANKRDLIVFLTEKNSPRSNKVLQKILNNKEIVEYMEKKAIFVIVVAKRDSYPIELLYTLEYPTLFFLDREELFFCEPLSGAITPKAFLECIKPN